MEVKRFLVSIFDGVSDQLSASGSDRFPVAAAYNLRLVVHKAELLCSAILCPMEMIKGSL